MKRQRNHISLETKLAAALLQMVRPDATGKLSPVIPYEDSKMMSARQIISLFHFDHGILHAHGGADEPWNLTPLPIREHRQKTATIDIPSAAKSDRVGEKEAAHRIAMALKEPGRPRPRKGTFKSRGFEKRA